MRAASLARSGGSRAAPYPGAVPDRDDDVVLFDLDGVLVDSRAAISGCINHALVANGLSERDPADLYRYIGHLADNEQAAQSQQIQFWKRALYPFACLVMIGLALPFAYMSARAGGVSLKVFGGIMLGISFVLLNNVAGHLGLLRNWTPWIVAATPSALYMLMSFAAFSWLVRYR